MAKRPTRGAALVGASRLAVEAVHGITALVEAVHMQVLHKAVGSSAARPVAAVTTLVYRSVHGVTRALGGGIDALLGRLEPALAEPWEGRDALLAALNGVLGDRLARTNNPLAIPMSLRVAGAPGPRIVVLAHGLCMNDQQWARGGEGHGAALARERGYTAVYLHYNTGLHISENGRALAAQLQALVDGWPVPVEEIAIVGHSMGGLVARSAIAFAEAAGDNWRTRLRTLVTLGSPHHGAPLERGGNWVHHVLELNAYSAPFARLAKLRSAGITDLRHGSVCDADWQAGDRFAHGAALPAVLALPDGVRCYALAGRIGAHVGDGLVPVDSALGKHDDPARCLHFSGEALLDGVDHLDLLSAPAVCAQLLAWLQRARGG